MNYIKKLIIGLLVFLVTILSNFSPLIGPRCNDLDEALVFAWGQYQFELAGDIAEGMQL
jgi:hypothetical protein